MAHPPVQSSTDCLIGQLQGAPGTLQVLPPKAPWSASSRSALERRIRPSKRSSASAAEATRFGVDLIHVTEYVWKASSAFHDEPGPERDEWVSDRLLRILCGESSGVAAGMRRNATLRDLAQKQRKEVDRCANYLLKYHAYLRYDECLEQGFPIATGVIEGACRHLVKDRMELTGARWRLARSRSCPTPASPPLERRLRRLLAFPRSPGVPAQSCGTLCRA